MEGESGITPTIIDEFDFSDIQGDEMYGERYVTRCIIDALHFSDIQ